MHETVLTENQNHLYAAYFSAVGLRHSETWKVARVKILRKDLLQPSKRGLIWMHPYVVFAPPRAWCHQRGTHYRSLHKQRAKPGNRKHKNTLIQE